MKNWIDIKILPEKSMVVEWFCDDGVKDVGYFDIKSCQFLSFELKSKNPIVYWRKAFKNEN